MTADHHSKWQCYFTEADEAYHERHTDVDEQYGDNVDDFGQHSVSTVNGHLYLSNVLVHAEEPV